MASDGLPHCMQVWGLRATLRFDGMIGHDFSLGRAYERSGCRAMRPNCAEDSCTAADVLARPWHKERGGLPTMPARPAPTYAYGGEQTRHSCGEGYFTCSKRSRMCKEEEEAWEEEWEEEWEAVEAAAKSMDAGFVARRLFYRWALHTHAEQKSIPVH